MPVLILKTLIGFNFSGLNPFASVATVLRPVDGVLFDTFSKEAAATVVDSARAWGMAQFALCLFVWLVLARYRAGLPGAILALLIEQIGRTGGGLVRVVAEMAAGSALPAASALINLAMVTALAAAFVLSLLAMRTTRASP